MAMPLSTQLYGSNQNLAETKFDSGIPLVQKSEFPLGETRMAPVLCRIVPLKFESPPAANIVPLAA